MAQKRTMIDTLKAEYPVRTLCHLLDCSPSSYYYQLAEKQTDTKLESSIESLLSERPYLGYRMIQIRLAKKAIVASERQIRHILRRLKGTRSVGRVQTTDSGHTHPRFPNAIRGLTPKHPDHVWVADITYIRYGRQFVYLAVILDAYTRAVRGWQLEEFLTCEALTLPALKMALKNGKPTYFHSDQGRQYAATDHVDLLKKYEVVVSMSDAGCPTQNGLVERFIRTLKDEHVAYSEYGSFGDMRRQVKVYLEKEYNVNRPHSALGYMTPTEFEAEYRYAEGLGVHLV